MTTIQIVGVQHPAGRKQEHVRAFGYRTADARKAVVEIAISADEAGALIAAAQTFAKFPEVEVDDSAWMHVLAVGDDIRVVHVEEKEPSA